MECILGGSEKGYMMGIVFTRLRCIGSLDVACGTGREFGRRNVDRPQVMALCAAATSRALSLGRNVVPEPDGGAETGQPCW